MPENILILADWRLAGIVDDTMPPRDPNVDDDEEEEDEEEGGQGEERSAASRQGTRPRRIARSRSTKPTQPRHRKRGQSDPTSLGHSGACG
jgi:hypothetical protein